jgi:hypothetical protein
MAHGCNTKVKISEIQGCLKRQKRNDGGGCDKKYFHLDTPEDYAKSD